MEEEIKQEKKRDGRYKSKKDNVNEESEYVLLSIDTMEAGLRLRALRPMKPQNDSFRATCERDWTRPRRNIFAFLFWVCLGAGGREVCVL